MTRRLVAGRHSITRVIVEPRSDANTGEKVLAQDGDGRIYVGNWWKKYSVRELYVDPALGGHQQIAFLLPAAFGLAGLIWMMVFEKRLRPTIHI